MSTYVSVEGVFAVQASDWRCVHVGEFESALKHYVCTDTAVRTFNSRQPLLEQIQTARAVVATCLDSTRGFQSAYHMLFHLTLLLLSVSAKLRTAEQDVWFPYHRPGCPHLICFLITIFLTCSHIVIGRVVVLSLAIHSRSVAGWIICVPIDVLLASRRLCDPAAAKRCDNRLPIFARYFVATPGL